MRSTLMLVGAVLLAAGLSATRYCDAQTTLNPEADSEVRSGAYADTNYGSAPTLYVREQTSGTCNRAVFRFDLSSISGTVTDAKLKLYVDTAPSSNATHRLYFMSDDNWVESTITWNNCPSTSSTSTTWAVNTTDADTWKEIDVTSLVSQEAGGDDELSVLVMADEVQNVIPQYRSREYSGTTYDPQLVVTTGTNSPPVADAGDDDAVTDTDESGSETVTLDGSDSSDSDGTITSWVWKEGTTQIATGETVQVSLAVGQHTITLTVTDDDSATDSDQVVMTVHEGGSTETTLYPAADTEVRSGAYADTNYGAETTLYVREQTSGTCNRAVFRFDLSSISGTVTDAKLKLYVNTAPSSNATHRLYFMSDDNWVESTITWNNCPGVTSTGTTWAVNTTDTGTWKEIGVTSLVSQEAGGDDELSVLVMADEVQNVVPQYRSRESSGSIYDPQLVVTTGTNSPPVADAGDDDAVTDTDESGSETVTLDGSDSSDSDGTITSWVWKEGTTQIATGETVQVSLAVGQHTITLTVTDDDSATDSDQVVMTVTAGGNQPPLADAGDDDSVTDTDESGSETVTLDGLDSSDSDGTITSWVWKEGTTQIATGETVQVSLAVGQHTITLTVTDDDSATDSDQVVMTVHEGGSTETTLYPAADTEVRSGAYADTNYGAEPTLYVREQTSGTCNRAVFRFDLSSISGTVTDAKLRLYVDTAPSSNATHRLYFMSDDNWVESTITWNNCPGVTSTGTTWAVNTTDTYTWTEIGVTSLVSQEAGGDDELSVVVMADEVQNVVPQYRSKESSGTTYDPRLVVTTGTNSPPVADAGDDDAVTDTDESGSETMTLDGSDSSDSDGTITNWVWKEGTTQIATGETVQVSLAVGQHTITLTVTDDDSATDSDQVVMTVNAGGNQPPLADAGDDDSVTDTDESGSETVTLDGSDSSDSDGTITSWVWKEGTTQIATGETVQVSLAVGQHTITLTVTDDDSATDSDQVVMTVHEGGNQPPVADAGPDQLVSDTDHDSSELVTLDGSGSSDSDGTITSWVWKEGTSQIATGSTAQVSLDIVSHSITLVVTDDAAATASDTVVVNVFPNHDPRPLMEDLIDDKQPTATTPFTFVAFGDWQGSAQTGAFTYTHEIQPDFALLLGDTVNNGDDPGDWYELEEAADGLFDEMPCWPVMGNHDSIGPQFYTAYWGLPSSGIHSFSYGNTMFVMLPMQWLGSSGLEALEDVLSSAQGKHIFVFGHMPYYGVADFAYIFEREEAQAIIALLEEYEVVAMFSGHEHTYNRTVRDGIHYIVSSVAGSIKTITDETNALPGDAYYGRDGVVGGYRFQYPSPTEPVYFDTAKYMISVISFDGETYTHRLVDTANGTEWDEFTLLSLPAAASSAESAAPASWSGDVDGDGLVTAADQALLDDVLNGRITAPEIVGACDLDGDGLVTAADQALLDDILSGRITAPVTVGACDLVGNGLVDAHDGAALAALLDEDGPLPAMRVRAALDRSWCYQNAPAVTRDGHYSLLAVEVQHDPYDNDTYAVWLEVDEAGAGQATIEPTEYPCVWRIVGGPRANPPAIEPVLNEVTVVVTVVGLETGAVGQACITLTVRQLGDVNGDGVVGELDQDLLNRCLSRRHVNPQAAEQCDLDGDGAVARADAELLSRIIRGAPLE